MRKERRRRTRRTKRTRRRWRREWRSGQRWIRRAAHAAICKTMNTARCPSQTDHTCIRMDMYVCFVCYLLPRERNNQHRNTAGEGISKHTPIEQLAKVLVVCILEYKLVQCMRWVR